MRKGKRERRCMKDKQKKQVHLGTNREQTTTNIVVFRLRGQGVKGVEEEDEEKEGEKKEEEEDE